MQLAGLIANMDKECRANQKISKARESSKTIFPSDRAINFEMVGCALLP